MDTDETPIPAPLPPRRSRKRMLISIFLGLVLLCCGMVIGSGATVYILSSRILEGIRNPDSLPDIAAQRMRYKLDLSDEQTEKIRAIFDTRKKEIFELRVRMQPKIEERIEELRAEVEAILTPEQAEKWDRRIDLLRRTLLPSPNEVQE